MPLLLIFPGLYGPQTLSFVDATGLNPLPAGVIVTITSATTGALVATGMLQAGGFAPFQLSYGQFTATFVGTQAPLVPVTFFSAFNGGSTVVVTGYQSPVYSAAGYAVAIASNLTRGWFTNPAGD